MKTRKIIHFLAIGFAFCACQMTDNSKRDGAEPILIPIANAEFIDIKLKDFFENAEYVFLETNKHVILGELPEMIECVDEFFVFDKYSQKKVFRFDTSGKFLNTIGILGQGPGEYTRPDEVLISGNYVEILSGTNHTKVLQYTRTGEIGGEFHLDDNTASSFVKDPYSSDYLFYYSWGPYKMLRVSHEGEIKDSLFIHNQADRMDSGADVFFQNINGPLIFRESLYNSVYHLTPNGFELKYLFDFGSDEYDVSGDGAEYFSQHVKNKGLWTTRWLQENEDFLCCTVIHQYAEIEKRQNVDVLHIVYDKKTNITYEIDTGESPMILGGAFALTEENQLYMTMNPAQLGVCAEWINLVNERNFPFNIEGNPIICIVDLNMLLLDN